MELHYGIQQPLRFYETLDHQNRFRKGGESKVFKLLSPSNYMLPFQIKRSALPVPVTSVKYVSTKDASEIEVINDLVNDQLRGFPFVGYDILVHFGSQELINPIPPGEYYIKITDNTNVWFSELIDVQNFGVDDLSMNRCAVTKITYWDTCDVAGIFYRTLQYGSEQYKNILYLDVDIGKPNYEFVEDGEEDAEGNFIAEYKRLEKQYVIQGVFPEYMVDALSLLPLHIGGSGNVQVLTSRGYTGAVDKMTVSPNWEGNLGVWALTDIVFNTEFVVKTNCCDNFDTMITTCLRDYSEHVATLVENSSDYNDYQYTDASDNSTAIPLVSGDLVLIHLQTGEFLMQQFVDGPSGPTYIPPSIVTSKGDVYADANLLDGSIILGPSTIYYYKTTGSYFSSTPEITNDSFDFSSGKRKVEGMCWNDCLVNLYVVGPFGQTLIEQTTGYDFNQNGILYDFFTGATGLFIECKGLTCDLGQSSNYVYPFGGVGVGAVGSTLIVG